MNTPHESYTLTKAQVMKIFTITCCVSLSSPACLAQVTPNTLEEVVVTAQKREQSAQDISVAVTALTAETMAVNRVFDVSDLSGLAPNLTTRQSPGAVNTVSFSMRGITSYGSLPGTDKQISTYLDGVYLGNPRGTIFNLPLIQRIEILRGPQGTLFGRNATGGAISVSTQNPTGELGFSQEISLGNRDLLRSSSALNLPAWGPLSVAVSYVHEEQDGAIKNLGAATEWDRTALGYGTNQSPETFNAKENDAFFLAAEFVAADNFRLIYKYDYSSEQGSPGANVPVAVNADPAILGANGAAFLNALVAANPNVEFYPQARRPDSVNNNYHLPRDQTNDGHNLTLLWEYEDFTIKNITAYRNTEAEVSASNLAGLGYTLGSLSTALGLPADTPVCILCSHVISESEQWSNELQFIYDSQAITLTAGLLYYQSEDNTGMPTSPETLSFAIFPNATLQPSSSGYFSNEAESTAAYTQAEFHLNETLDVIAGYRLTRDDKSGSYLFGPAGNTIEVTDDYKDDNPSYLLSINYHPIEDLLVYVKYSTAFVSGGSIAGIAFSQEDATSWEAGLKGEFLDKRLRANLAVFNATYENLQTLQAGSNIGRPEVSVAVVDLGGDVETSGAELEITALPVESIILNWSLGYTDVSYTDVRDILRASNGGTLFPNSDYLPTLVPRWTSNLSATYETAPLFDSSFLSFSINGIWRSKMRMDSNPGRAEAVPQFANIEYSPESLVVNARLALRDITFGAWRGEMSLWGQNLTDNDVPTYALNFGSFAASANFMEPRSYGVDFKLVY